MTTTPSMMRALGSARVRQPCGPPTGAGGEARAETRTRRGPRPVADVRGVPHRPACRGGRPGRAPGAGDAGAGGRGEAADRRARHGSRSVSDWGGNGVPWLRRTCGTCRWCRSGRENLCRASQYTGWDADGGYAESTTVPEGFAYRFPEEFDDATATPLLCAGIIGYRALRRAQVPPGAGLGLHGFGGSAHLTAQVAMAGTSCRSRWRHLLPAGRWPWPGST